MKRRVLTYAAAFVYAGLVMTACHQDNPAGTENELTSDEVSLEKDFGGYSTSDEAPMFDDAEVMVEAVSDEPVVDSMSDEATAAFESNRNTVSAYALRLKWGLLAGDSTATEVVDWSGSAVVSRGALAVMRLINFERNTDHLVLPRTSRQEVAFTSFTRPYFDGLVLMIIDQDTTDQTGTFTLNAGAYSRTFTFEELDSLELVEPVGSGGHEVSIVSEKREVTPFAGGFLAGRWAKTEAHSGVFHGRWINSEGTNAGFMRGIWGTRRNGEQVFFGKYIGLNGGFKGLLKGRWEYTRDDRAGHFWGHWHNRNRDAQGELKGHFRTGRPGDRHGFFSGRWIVKG